VSASFRGMNNSSDELILGLKSIAERYGALLQTHACYSYFTRDASIVQFGKPEIARLEALGVLDEKMLLLHAGWLEPEEIALLARRKPTLVCCPSSSIHNGYGNIAVGKHPELMALGVNVSLGSDHASSGTVDMVQEMRYCACGYKEARLNPRLMPPEHVVEMATINGARGAGLADRIGSIEGRGRKPISCCSMRRYRNGSRCTTRCRTWSTARPGTPSGMSSYPASRWCATAASRGSIRMRSCGRSKRPPRASRRAST